MITATGMFQTRSFAVVSDAAATAWFCSHNARAREEMTGAKTKQWPSKPVRTLSFIRKSHAADAQRTLAEAGKSAMMARVTTNKNRHQGGR